jgi:hypothetical protein
MYEKETEEINALKRYLLSHIPSTPLPPNNLLLSPKSIALKAAIAGLDKELGRLEREERLVRKFTNENTVYDNSGSRAVAAAPSSTDHNNNADEDVAMEYVKMTKEDAAMKRENDDEDDWEEAASSPSKKKQSLTDSQDLQHEIAQKWSSSTISRIAKADARVDTPVGALGLALHTALVELTATANQGTKKMEQMFRCTGVPDRAIISQFLGEETKNSGGGCGAGFAPPIRELPKGELVPSNWEDTAKKQQDAQLIAFRYKCGQDVYTTSSGPTNDCTTIYLMLKQINSSTVRVSFGPMPASTKGGATTTMSSNQLQFPLTQHINLDGFQASKSKSSSSVQPSLFFISLPELLLQFGSTFGLLSVMQLSFGEGTLATEEVGLDTETNMSVNMKDVSTNAFVNPAAAATNVTKVDSRPNIPPDGPALDIDPLRVMDSRTGMGCRRGDFEGDLLPGGIQPGLPGGPSFGGSQVGPNHPMFDRSFGDDDLYNTGIGGGSYGPPSFGIPGVGGGVGMRPRFDPYGPPGGPTEPGRGGRGGRGGGGRGGRFGSGRGRGGGRGRMPPGGFGDPNNDHLQPPNSDYFS